jgi:hypothetical protein
MGSARIIPTPNMPKSSASTSWNVYVIAASTPFIPRYLWSLIFTSTLTICLNKKIKVIKNQIYA